MNRAVVAGLGRRLVLGSLAASLGVVLLAWGLGACPAYAGEDPADDPAPLLVAQAGTGAETGQTQPSDDYGDVKATEVEKAESPTIADPLEPWNRLMYHFNDKFYFWLAKPVAQGYKYVIPQDFRGLIGNAFDNIAAPIRIVNNLLQLKVGHAGTELLRFLVNSTVGVGGLRDCAKDCFGIKQYREDLGQTFGYYGIGHGFYIVWPVLGPSSARDSVGKLGDWFLQPITYVKPPEAHFGLVAEEKVNELSFHIGDYEAIKGAALDPYVAMRDGYLQLRRKAVEE